MRHTLTLTPENLARLVDGHSLEIEVLDDFLEKWHVTTLTVETKGVDWKPLVLAVARRTAVPSL